MPFAIIRIAKLKKSSVGGSGSHVSRSRPTPNADRSKLANNQTLIHNNDRELPLGEVVASKIAANHKGRKIRPDAVHCVEILLTASPEYFRPNNPAAYGSYDPAVLDRWKHENVEWLKREYGDKIVRAELHLDEATPHIHAFLVPLDERGQLNCRGIFGERKKMFALQDSYSNAMKPLGLQRAERESKATHTSVKKYYSEVNEFCGSGADSVIADLKSENVQLKQQLSQCEKNLGELRLELDRLQKQLDEKIRELKAETPLLQVTVATQSAVELPVNIVEVTPNPVMRCSNAKANPAIKPKPPNRSPISDGNPLNHIREIPAIALENEPKPTPAQTSTVTAVATTPPRPEPSHSTEIVAEIEIQPRLDPEAAEQKAPQKQTAQASSQKRRDRGGR
jgi:Plasmid recombination enzyme